MVTIDLMMWIRSGGNFVHFHILISNFDISLYNVGREGIYWIYSLVVLMYIQSGGEFVHF